MNAGEATADEGNNDGGSAQYAAKMRLLQDYLEKDSGGVWVANRRGLLYDWLG